MDQDDLLIRQSYVSCRSISEKWKVLKPVISDLYVDQEMTLKETVEQIRRRYGFDASERQYKYQINRQWKLKKNISASAKTKMLEVYGGRKGKSTALDYQGRPVDKKRLARMARAQAVDLSHGQKLKNKDKATSSSSRQPVKLKMAPRIFMKWNMPYGAMRFSRTGPINHVSPYAIIPSPAAEIKAYTPSANSALSPPADSPSGLAKALWLKTGLQRAHAFMQGEHEELLRTMDKQEQGVMATWLYQFWLFAYKTARKWGKGPRNWTQGLLELDRYMDQLAISAPGTPGSNGTSPAEIRNGTTASSWLLDGRTPSILCNWSVHLPSLHYERIATPESDDSDDDVLREKDWPKSNREDFLKKLHNALRNNHFSNIDEDKLPICLPHLLQSAEFSKNDLLEEGLAFSIMGRNVPLLYTMTNKIRRSKIKIEGLYPFHLATSYISGADPCCNVICGLLYQPSTFPIREAYVNGRGHSVLDNLMLAIIKSHTKCAPGDIDESMRREARFAGEEVDICGRWDGDSDEIRNLLSTGASKIPLSWKHKFCHTSAQVICHCINLIFGTEWSPDINHVSGLFKKVCHHSSCTAELKPLPLHTVVLVAFQLAQQGCEGEDLFGIIACLLCLISKGVNPMLTADLSAPELFGSNHGYGCSHQALDPLQLANRLPPHLYSRWSPPLQTGWKLMCHVLRLSQKVWQPDLRQASFDTPSMSRFSDFISYPDDDMTMEPALGDPMDIEGGSNQARDRDDDASVDEDINHCWECGNRNNFRGSLELRDLWAAAQAELLTYRRIRDGENWTSPSFDMARILRNIERDEPLSLDLVERQLLRDYCDCGNFTFAEDEDCPCVDDVCKEYFSNLEEWERTNYIACPEKWWEDGADDWDDYDEDDEDESDEDEDADF